MNKKYITIFFIIAIFSFLQNANAKMYECTYKNKYGKEVTSSYNSFITTQPNHKELVNAFKNGNCKELIIKRYFIDGTMCNIQFFKYNEKISHVTCKPNKPSAMQKIKEIAKNEYGYYE